MPHRSKHPCRTHIATRALTGLTAAAMLCTSALGQSFTCTTHQPGHDAQMDLQVINGTSVRLDGQEPAHDQVSVNQTPSNTVISYKLKGRSTALAIVSSRTRSARVNMTQEGAQSFWFCDMQEVR